VSGPRLVAVRTPDSPEGVVVVLHGGASRGEQVMVSPTQLSVLRMIPLAHRIARAGRARLAVHRLLNSHRGWDTTTTPAMDARWAVEQVRDRHGDLPVALVGHSLGGRAALLAGDDPHVRCVVALNPWVLPTDRVDLRGRKVLVVHGTDDRVAPPSRSADLVRRLRASTDVEYVLIPEGKHAMLRHGRDFESWASEFVVSTLLT
jgi:alpha-beta hydrolase superfamily lysophospholipase